MARRAIALSAAAALLAVPASASAVTAAVDGDRVVVTSGLAAERIVVGRTQLFEGSAWHPYYNVTSFSLADGTMRKVTAGPGCKNGTTSSGFTKEAYCPVTVTSVHVSGGGGADDIGTWCSARYITDPLTIDGGEGSDALAGATEGSRRVTLLGGNGQDTLQGTPCGDNPHPYPVTARGGPHADLIVSHCGTSDRLLGEDGNDTFWANDSAADVVSGGLGSDKAAVDSSLDTRTSIETTFTSEYPCDVLGSVTPGR